MDVASNKNRLAISKATLYYYTYLYKFIHLFYETATNYRKANERFAK